MSERLHSGLSMNGYNATDFTGSTLPKSQNMQSDAKNITETLHCNANDCVKPVSRRGLCWKHYSLDTGRTKGRIPKAPCACGKPFYARNKCKTCYMTWFRSVDKIDTFEPFALHPKHFDDLWVFITKELGITGASTRKETI